MPDLRRLRPRLLLVVTACVLGGAVAVAVGLPATSAHEQQSALARPASPPPPRNHSAPLKPRPAPSPRTTGASATTVAFDFSLGWLACTYHQGPCTQIPGSLQAYGAALRRQPERSLATPAERAAQISITRIGLTRDCRDEAVAAVTYTSGSTSHFEIHLNLVREPDGWRVFDVAEAPPHIPPPAPLSRGTGAC
jgi:hypothetical protein